MRKFWTYLVLALFAFPAFGFEYVNEKKSYENLPLFSLHLGLGINQFAHTTGIEGGNPGLAFQLGIGHRLSPWLGGEFVYQMSTFRFSSPDPIFPNTFVNTRAGLHQEYLRAKIFYPKVVAQPYVGLGFGAYQFVGIDGLTALASPSGLEIPLSLGVQTFIHKNRISLDFDFTYHFLFGEGQDSRTLTTLGLDDFGFNMYSLLGGFTFHFL